MMSINNWKSFYIRSTCYTFETFGLSTSFGLACLDPV